MTFAEVIAMAGDDMYEVSQGGLDYLFEIFEHVALGGSIDGLPDPETAIVMLAAGWLTIANRVHNK